MALLVLQSMNMSTGGLFPSSAAITSTFYDKLHVFD